MGENFETHRFYLFTKTLTSEDPEEEADIQTDKQHENTTESGQDKDTKEDGDQLTQKRHNRENQIEIVEDEQSTATMSTVGPLTGGLF